LKGYADEPFASFIAMQRELRDFALRAALRDLGALG
jgi:hypothetical protein